MEINHDDGYGYAEDETHQQQCGHCEKTFTFTTAISYDYDVSKADCLNGAEHRFKPTCTFPKEFSRLRCESCGEEKPLVALP